MKRTHLILFISGALIAAGMVTSYYGSKLATQDLAITEGAVISGSPIEVIKELDPSVTGTGAFVVHVENFDSAILRAAIFDPSGGQISSAEITQASTEKKFEIGTKGAYKLVLENSGSEVSAVIGLTHMPDKAILALNVLGQSIIVSGFLGLGITGVYAVKNRRKNLS
ncbi:MAG: hypothetical protein MN733_18290 [Nitrososphaera sp.]|nr:hypothetical protein [Nitrososphaera sp.]